jgi:drug/metabolite transporter (DMT)-like permease
MRPIDALLLLMALIWGTNYALVKSVFRELDPQAFNALRMLLASAVMTATSHLARRTTLMRAASPVELPSTLARAHSLVHDNFHTPARVTRSDWRRLTWLGLIGHCLYQYLFVGGLARTSVANGALIVSSTPIVITFFSSLSRRERPGRLHWAGTLLSLAGIYVVVGRGAHIGGASMLGDLMLMGAVLCWAGYTLGARSLMERHSPVGVTAMSMVIGTAVYVPLVATHLARVPWAQVSTMAWVKLVYSAIFALCVSYTIWYAAVRVLGSARTSLYSNLLPIIAMVTAYVWLHEPIGATKMAGAAAVLAGVALARMGTVSRTMDGP